MDLEKRISVLEIEHEYSQKTLDKLENKLDDITDAVFSTKERLDKQNGMIPRMVEQQEILIRKFDDHINGFNNHLIKCSKTDFKVKVIYGAMATIFAGFAGVIIKTFF